MAIKKRLIRDEVSFTTDTDDILIDQPRYIDSFDIALDYLQNGTTAPTLADALGIIESVQVKLGGRIITELSGTDLLALNALMLGREIKYIVPAGDNQAGTIEGLRLPVWLTPSELSLAIRFNKGSVATIDTEQLTFSVLEADEPLRDRHLEMPRFSFTPPSTGTFNTALDTSFAGDLIGLLVYSTTIPTTTNDNASVAKLRLKVDGDIVYEGNWLEMSADTTYPGDSTLKGIVDNYVFLDFRRQPYPAGSSIAVDVESDDTNIVRIIPIVAVG